jgi:hypothetical protein
MRHDRAVAAGELVLRDGQRRMDTNSKNTVSMTLFVPTDAGGVTVRIEYAVADDADSDAHDAAITALDTARQRLRWTLGDTASRSTSLPAVRGSVFPTSIVAALVPCLVSAFLLLAFLAGYHNH